ncbi:MAG: Rieske 2Fe-2S domain-containing protein [Acidimicrobiia bacterium]|jgi:nitrite reductase/ring-hydroxylating ferredoxin subunit
MSATEMRPPRPGPAVRAQEIVGLPMPRDAEMALDPARRPSVRHDEGKRFPFPIPNGWFIVAQVSDVAPGEIKRVHYFGRELVLFRTESGEAHLVGSYCAHLGANLAVGGKVEGEGIRCPFHGWCYDGASGKCVDIPYTESDHIPSQAKVRSYPTVERNRMIWAWHHLEGSAPFYDVPEVPEFDSAAWSEPVCRDFTVATCCQEMAENNHDFAHFKYVHGSDDIPWDTEELVDDSPYKRAEASSGFVRESFGLGLGVLRYPDYFTFLSSTTPIDEEHVHVRWTFVTPIAAGEGAAVELSDTFLAAVSQDIPIWENKAFLPRPVLAKEETGILAHRKWSEQFYSDPANALD